VIFKNFYKTYYSVFIYLVSCLLPERPLSRWQNELTLHPSKSVVEIRERSSFRIGYYIRDHS